MPAFLDGPPAFYTRTVLPAPEPPRPAPMNDSPACRPRNFVRMMPCMTLVAVPVGMPLPGPPR